MQQLILRLDAFLDSGMNEMIIRIVLICAPNPGQQEEGYISER